MHEFPAPSAASEARRAPSLLMVNTFLLLGLFILVFASPRVEDTFTSYMIGVGVEFALALLAILFMRLERVPVRHAARLHWPGGAALFWTLLMAPGLWLIALGINIITATLFGYVMPVPPTVFPQDLAGAIAMLLATVVAAPLCEELIFRGYVQRAYERGGLWIGIPATALIFALYHLRFQGLLSLIPISLLLGFVVWRTHSLLPAIALHMVHNGAAALWMLSVVFLPLPVVNGLALMGLCVTLMSLPLLPVGMWRLWRATAPPQPEHQPPQSRVKGWARWLWLAPLAALLLFYGYAAVIEVVVAGFPKLLASESLALAAPAAWDAEMTWDYGLYTTPDQSVGAATCTLSPTADEFTLHCTADRAAFSHDLTLPAAWFGIQATAEAATWEQKAVWDRATLGLVAFEGRRNIAGQRVTTSLVASNGAALRLTVADAVGSRSMHLPADVLIQEEWPWRLIGVPFDIAYSASRPLLWLDDTGTPHLTEAYVLVEGGEPVWTPAGNFITWKVSVTYTDAEGHPMAMAAWYAATPPHTLVRYDDGVVRYLLEE